MSILALACRSVRDSTTATARRAHGLRRRAAPAVDWLRRLG
jgi:hypothetical protein